jgi:ATP-binding cassette subfamily B protein
MAKERKNKIETGKKKKSSSAFDPKILIKVYKLFFPHYKNHWKTIVIGFVALVASIGLGLLAPWPLKLIIDYVILNNPFPAEFAVIEQVAGNDPLKLLWWLAIAYFVIKISDSFISYLYKIGLSIAGASMVNEFRERIFAHLQRLSMSFHKAARSGDIVYRMTRDINEIKGIILDAPQQFINRIFSLVMYLGLMLFMNWELALFAFSIIPLVGYANRKFGTGMKKARRKQKKKESKVSTIIADNITAMALVQAYGREDLQHARFTAENQQSLKFGIKALKLSKLFKRVNGILIAIGTALVVYFGGKLVLGGEILPGTLVLFASYLKKLYGPLDKFSGLLFNLTKSQVAVERLLELLENESIIKDSPDAIEAPKFRGEIEFVDVSFSYMKNEYILKNLSFKVHPGENIAIVGHSGTGKTTLVSLLMRFYDPQHGKILFDGCDIRNFKLESMRNQITIVLQDAKLFNQTVYENIAFGKIGATREEVVSAAKLARADEFIRQMPQGYDTIISEGGNNLSGGQKQRINIARAIIRDTPIVIFDEPATALDGKTEDEINKAVHELASGKVSFTIAHKFSTIANADKIIVLDQGKEAAFGTHTELLEKSNAYRNLYELQRERPKQISEQHIDDIVDLSPI